MKSLNEHERNLLRSLQEAGGIATSKQLGGYTPLGSRARVSCSHRGLALYDGDGGSTGCWKLTDAGRAALASDHQ
jgi:hypothetical protein